MTTRGPFATLTPAGASQATAATLNADLVLVLNAASGAIRVDDTFDADDTRIICNGDGVNALSVYPKVGGRLNNGSINGAIAIAPNSSALVRAIDALDAIVCSPGAATSSFISEITQTIPANGPLYSHNPSNIDATANPFFLNYSKGSVVAGATNPNDKWTLGYNVAPAGTHSNTSDIAMWFSWDTNAVVRSGIVCGNFSFTGMTADGANFGFISCEIPQTTSGLVQAAFRADTIQVTTRDAVTELLIFQPNSNVVFFPTAGTAVRIFTNNNQTFQQFNAEGNTYIALPYINAGDIMEQPTGAYFVGSRTGSGATYPGAFVTLQPTGASDGDIMLNMVGPTFTGGLYAFQASASPTTGLIGAIWSNSATSTANAQGHYRVISGSGGDPFVLFDINGVTTWSIGADNSDSDKFKISQNGTLGSNDCMVIDTSGNATLGSGNLGVGTAAVSSAALAIKAGTTSLAQMNLASSSAPTSPNNGDIWFDGTNLKIRINGATKTVTVS